jgi:hypothetical protein
MSAIDERSKSNLPVTAASCSESFFHFRLRARELISNGLELVEAAI